MKPLDAIDLKILRTLQADGRLCNQALCERAGLPPRACLDRVRRLEREGRIAGYHARIGRDAHGSLMVVHAEVILVDQRQATLAQFEQRAVRCPEGIACHLVSGPSDYLVRFACTDLAPYQRLSDSWINHRTMGVARIVSHTELRSVKEFAGYPV
jgi:Lrp/AsnC family leucine-responsive transcriptional regulator